MNRVFSRFQRSVVFAVFFSLAMPTAWAEKSAREQLHAEFPTEDLKAKRPSEDVLPKSIVNFAKANFPWNEADFYAYFGKTLTTALIDLAKPNEVRGEREAAYVVARLFGTADADELERATTATASRLDAIDAKKPPTPADKQERDFLQRILWGIQIIDLSEDSVKLAKEKAPATGDRFAEFKKVFDPIMKLVSEEGADFLRLKDAILKADADPAKKAELQAQLKSSFRSVPSFMDRKLDDRSASNKALGKDLLNALATDGKLDLFDHNGQPARVDLGSKPERYEEAWRQARKEFPPIQRPQVNDEGVPKTEDPLAGARLSPQLFKKVENTFVSKAAGENPSKPVKKGPEKSPELDAKFVTTFKDMKCLSCHKSGRDPEFVNAKGELNEEGRGALTKFFDSFLTPGAKLPEFDENSSMFSQVTKVKNLVASSAPADKANVEVLRTWVEANK